MTGARIVFATLVVLIAGLIIGPRQSIRCFASRADIASAIVRKYAYEAYPDWRAAHPHAYCPVSLLTLNEYMNNKDTLDPWDRDYAMLCAAGHLYVSSSGEDGVFGTDDDVRSY
jgi:hypothetical protein